MPKIERILESVLYARDLDAAESFYGGILGLEVIRRSDLFITFRCADGVLLPFDPGESGRSGRSVPFHGTQGPGHLAFAVRPEELDAWRRHLESHGIEIENEVEREEGGRSVYFRDPAGNSLELAPPNLWGCGPASR
ncbi:MAG: VOC family protein [Candidatus Eisenbacteria bacterium]